VTTLERTPQFALATANAFIVVIKDMHDCNIPRLEEARRAATHNGNRELRAATSLALLQLSFGLARLAVHAGSLQSAAENETYARKFWASPAIGN